MKYKIAIGALVLILLLTFSSACVVVVTNAPPYGTYNGTTIYTTTTTKAQLTILKNELTKDTAGNKIGLVTIKNVSNYTAENIRLTGKFLDANNNIVYQANDTILSLGPNESWDFTFTCQGASCGSVRTFTVDVTYS
jgi:ABC-type metal ion transport system substrate-binding protein